MNTTSDKPSFHPSSIILIGPVCAGKSTQSLLLAERLSLPHVGLDEMFWRYNEDLGYSQERFVGIWEQQGLAGIFLLTQQLCAAGVERALREYGQGIFDFGAGHTHYEDQELYQRVRRLLAPYQPIILLLPSPDLDESVKILKERSVKERGLDWVRGGYDFIEHWVKDACNHELATHTIYTNGKMPEQTRDEILHLLVQ